MDTQRPRTLGILGAGTAPYWPAWPTRPGTAS